jgi:glycopeptide antibiotics resistance protein
MPEKLLTFAFESTLFVHAEGTVISNAPRNEIPKKTNNAKTKRLNAALVETWYKVSLPKIIVSNKPSTVNMVMIEREYNMAFLIPFALVLLLFKKKLTVTGNMAYRHG